MNLYSSHPRSLFRLAMMAAGSSGCKTLLQVAARPPAAAAAALVRSRNMSSVTAIMSISSSSKSNSSSSSSSRLFKRRYCGGGIERHFSSLVISSLCNSYSSNISNSNRNSMRCRYRLECINNNNSNNSNNSSNNLSKRHLSFSSISPKNLSDITNLPKLTQESPEIISDIWKTFHDEKQTSAHGDVISSSISAELAKLGKKFPICIVPVFKSADSYLILLTQFQDKHIIATFLDEYKKNPSGASPWLAISLYNELSKDKGLTLLRCDFLPNISKNEAKRTFEAIVDLYCRDEEMIKYLETFNLKPDSFDFNKFVAHVKSKYYPEFTTEH